MISEKTTKEEIYLAGWTSSLALLLSRLTSGQWQVEASHSPQDPLPVSVRITVAGWPGGQRLAWSAADTAKILQLFLGEEVSVGSELDEMQKEALEELVRQWCGLAATELKAELGELKFEPKFEPMMESAPSLGAQPLRLLVATEGANSIAVQVGLDAELESFLRQTATAVDTLPPPPAAPAYGARVEQLLGEGNLELLMDVELPVMLRFGTRQATLREVLDLATGAVLELDREVQEPVDLILNGKLIARGEVVVVDGNYGLRVTEVASPQQRVGSL